MASALMPILPVIKLATSFIMIRKAITIIDSLDAFSFKCPLSGDLLLMPFSIVTSMHDIHKEGNV
jgi:hypothetical protein